MPDKNLVSFANEDGLDISGLSIGSSETSFADLWKLSHVTNSVFTDVKVDASQANENALDCNRMCENVRIKKALLLGGKQCSIVVKGRCRNMTFEEVAITPHPASKYDIEWDGFSDQNKAHSTGRFVNCRRTDGKKLRVVFCRFVLPKFINTPYEIMWIESFKYTVYNLFKSATV